MSKKEFQKEPKYTHCDYCGAKLTGNRHPQKRFCNDSHRVMFCQKSKKETNKNA